MLIVLYFFTMELKKTKNIIGYKNYVIMNKKDDEYKEYLFTAFYKELMQNAGQISTDSVAAYLNNNSINYEMDNKKARLKYDLINKKIIFESYIDDYCFKRDSYEYKIIEGNLKFIYNDTKFIEGRIE